MNPIPSRPARDMPTAPTPAVPASAKRPPRAPTRDEQRMDTDYDPDPVLPAARKPRATPRRAR